MASLKLVDNAKLTEYGYPNTTNTKKIRVTNNEVQDQIRKLPKEQQPDEWQKYTLKAILNFANLSMWEVAELAARNQSLIVELQAYLRKMGMEFVRKAAAGEIEQKFEDSGIVVKNGTIRVPVKSFVNREKRSAKVPEPEKAKRHIEKIDDAQELEKLIQIAEAKLQALKGAQ